jgi:predicted 3-demethylubiquinone-9 3-methyltransferase (glyoxalase superfamily)
MRQPDAHQRDLPVHEVDPMKKLTPFLWFDDDLEQALDLYTSIFEDSTIVEVSRTGDPATGPLFSATFRINGQEFLAINGGPHFRFSEAVSLFVACDDQDEVDYLWGRLSEGGEPGQCGWLKDRFGLSWQIIPRRLLELLQDPDPARASRVREAMLAMGRIDVAALEAAHAGPA